VSDDSLFLFAGLAVWRLLMLQGAINTSEPRGIRNNNPLNIRATRERWKGQTGVDAAGFVIFEAPEYGIRAAARILNSYAARGVVSVQDIVTTWAPPIENNSAAYVEHMADVLGKNPGEPVERWEWPYLLAGMITHENGENPYTFGEINAGVAMA
jgi:hypothetical protein